MLGKFYAVGVGPGDPELMTLKAVRCIEESDVIAVAVSKPETPEVLYQGESEETYRNLLEVCTAYQIACPVCPGIEKKAKLFLPMPMMKDKEVLRRVHDDCAKKTAEFLKKGLTVAFITLGDPTVYSTCLYVHKRLKCYGYETEIIPGVPSFCAAAARLGMGLAENREEIHIIPASYQVEESLKLPGTKVLMKTGKKMPAVKDAIRRENLTVRMVENCGMDAERIYESVEDIPEEAGYFSLMILKEEEK
ncbi:MAG: precorrin-2 C(20)-methyltransferase [Lachnoclostridium sp.]|nr:precorrin-2 C(20)-methyltransferase [Lachnoclostridium sp.]